MYILYFQNLLHMADEVLSDLSQDVESIDSLGGECSEEILQLTHLKHEQVAWINKLAAIEEPTEEERNAVKQQVELLEEQIGDLEMVINQKIFGHSGENDGTEKVVDIEEIN